MSVVSTIDCGIAIRDAQIRVLKENAEDLQRQLEQKRLDVVRLREALDFIYGQLGDLVEASHCLAETLELTSKGLSTESEICTIVELIKKHLQLGLAESRGVYERAIAE